MGDQTEQLLQRVNQATSHKTPLAITGGGTKTHLGGVAVGTTFDIAEHSGIISYEPTELVVTVRAGTTMTALTSALAAEGQCLPFEPPLTTDSTIGGVLACGLSGPARPFTGSARDYVLGMRIINGLGQNLSFGGEVMKNVAGYDVSRLQVGAFGTLGVLLDTSMKVLPLPEATLSIQRDAQSTADLSELINLARKPLPITGLYRWNDVDTIRLAGSETAVNAAAKQIGGEVLADGDDHWAALRDLDHPFFKSDSHTLWRLSVPAHAAIGSLPGDVLYDWAGAQRWLQTIVKPEEVFRAARALGGHATCYALDDSTNAGFQPLEPGIASLHRRLRDSFDPSRIFNPGRFHPEVDR